MTRCFWLLLAGVCCTTGSVAQVMPELKLLDSLPRPALNIRKDSLLQRVGLKVKLPAVKLEKDSWFKHQALTAELQGQTSRAYFTPGSYLVQNDLRLNESFSVQNLPVSARFAVRTLAEETFRHQLIFNVQFEHETYVKSLRERLMGKLKPDDLIPDDEVVKAAKRKVEEMVKAEAAALQSKYGALIEKYRSPDALVAVVKEKAGDLKDKALQRTEAVELKNKAMQGEAIVNDTKQYISLLQQDPSKIKSQLMQSDIAAKVAAKQRELQVLQSKLQEGQPVDTTVMRQLMGEIDEYKELTGVYQKIIRIKEKIDKAASSKIISEAKAMKQVKFDKILQDPAKVKELAAKYLPLSSLEKSLMSLQRLKMGQSTTDISPLTLSNFNGNGISTSFSSGNKYLFLIYSKERSNSILDMPFAGGNVQQQTVGNYLVRGIRTGIGGSLDKNYAHLSVLSYKQKQAGQGFESQFTLPRSVLVLTLSNRMNLGEETVFEVEVSRSSAAVPQENTVTDTVQRNNAVLNKMLQANKGNQSIALHFNYEGHYKDIGLDASTQVIWLSKDYFNPGNPFAVNGSRQADMSLRKTFLEKKLQLNSRFSYRQYAFSTVENSSWQYRFFYLDARWSLDNGQFLSLKYAPSKGMRYENSRQMPTSASSKLTASGNVNRNFGSVYAQGLYNFGQTKNSYLYYTNGEEQHARSLNFLAAHNVQLFSRAISLNLQYDHVYQRSSEQLFNSTFSTDVSCNQPVGKQLSLTSGITWLSVKGWYQQAGLRQGISWSMNERIQADIFLDGRVNVGRPHQYFGYDDLFRGDWSLKYNF